MNNDAASAPVVEPTFAPADEGIPIDPDRLRSIVKDMTRRSEHARTHRPATVTPPRSPESGWVPRDARNRRRAVKAARRARRGAQS